jgi:hypothetical protein
MKKVFFLVGAMLLTFSLSSVVNAATTKSNSVCVCAKDDLNKEKITEDKLPQAVKDAITNDYKGWKVDVIYLVKGEKEYYEITLKLDAQSKIVKLGKDGKVVE